MPLENRYSWHPMVDPHFLLFSTFFHWGNCEFVSKWGCPPEWDFGLLNARPIPDYGSIIKRHFRGADIYNHSKSPSHNSISRKAYHIIHHIQQSQTSPHITSHFRNKPPPHSSRNKTPSHFWRKARTKALFQKLQHAFVFFKEVAHTFFKSGCRTSFVCQYTARRG